MAVPPFCAAAGLVSSMEERVSVYRSRLEEQAQTLESLARAADEEVRAAASTKHQAPSTACRGMVWHGGCGDGDQLVRMRIRVLWAIGPVASTRSLSMLPHACAPTGHEAALLHAPSYRIISRAPTHSSACCLLAACTRPRQTREAQASLRAQLAHASAERDDVHAEAMGLAQQASRAESTPCMEAKASIRGRLFYVA